MTPSESVYITKVCSNKRCSFRGTAQPSASFNRSSQSQDGLGSWCKTCKASSRPETRKRRKEKVKRIQEERSNIEVVSALTRTCAIKLCSLVGIEQPITEFCKNSNYIDGIDRRCKTCRSEVNREWTKQHGDEYLQRMRQRSSEYLDKIDVSISTKICRFADCSFAGKPQPLVNFGIKSNGTDGRSARCKTCIQSLTNIRNSGRREEEKERVKKWYHDNREKVNSKLRDKRRNDGDVIREKARNRRIKKWAKNKIWQCKQRSKEKGLPFNLDESDLSFRPEFCHVLWIKLDYKSGSDMRFWASIDRIVPELGYVKGNVRIISFAANAAKLDGLGDLINMRDFQIRSLASEPSEDHS